MRAFILSTLLLSLAAPQLAKGQSSESSDSVSKAYRQYERDRDAQRAHQEILSAIENSKNEITEFMQKVRLNETKSCADSLVVQFHLFLMLNDQQSFAREFITCITAAHTVIKQEPYEIAVQYAEAFHVMNITTMFMWKYLNFPLGDLPKMGLNVTNLTDRTWQGKIGRLRQLDIGDDGEVWGVNDDQAVFRWTGSTWVQPTATARLSGVTVGSRHHIWGVNRDQLVFKWNGSTWIQPDTAARLTQISAGPDGEVWGVGASGGVWRWNGSSWIQPLPSARLSHISVGSRDNIWGLGPDGSVFKWQGSTWVQPSPSARLKQVSVGPDGDVWGVNTGVYRWSGSSFYQPNPDARLAHIAVGKNGEVWGTAQNAAIFSRDLTHGSDLYNFYLAH